jgi:hypothetical protein
MWFDQRPTTITLNLKPGVICGVSMNLYRCLALLKPTLE